MNRKNTSSKVRKIILLTASAVIVFIAVSTAFSLWKDISAGRTTASAGTTAQVQRGNIEVLVSATGTLQPLDYVDVGAQVSGQLKKIHVEVGSEVKSGELLAEIDPTLFIAQVDASRAQLRYQQAQLKDREAQLSLAESQLKRQKNLFTEDATTLETVQNAEAEYKSALAQLEMLKAQIEQTESDLRADEANLNYAKIYAPMDGTVVSVSARQGQTLNANQSAPTILQIADLATMTVQTEVSEADIIKLKTGMRAYFTTLGGQGRRWYGELRRIEPTPTTENNVVLYNALFDVDNTERNLLPQMTAQVFFITASARDTFLVPVSAVKAVTQAAPSAEERGPRGNDNVSEGQQQRKKRQQQNSGTRTLSGASEATVLNPDGTTQIRTIKVGITNRIQAQILEGLNEGETVILYPSETKKTSSQQNNSFGPPPGAGLGMQGMR
ncbi:efflux RND transporter periplasmic adaptor subunit [Geovibrio thiophilus]|uniref:Efflux RND transporter periplasmic adaptor subunit n=1 Tax=Geovibrio thiophilus TaxID=139438 RepID=A0A3R5UZD3_9BACT|nr:efflux RND transporter periplasmic adaptor subunit [Geovibrio thiophilus]QAR33461.1 efflux RND transporter periplasmic adaptor subunit [Geovibrio thiophilus]